MLRKCMASCLKPTVEPGNKERAESMNHTQLSNVHSCCPTGGAPYGTEAKSAFAMVAESSHPSLLKTTFVM